MLWEELASEILQQTNPLGAHGEAAPAFARAIEDGPDQRDAAVLSRQAADDLHPAARLAEGALEQIGVADAQAVGDREVEVRGERVEIQALTKLNWNTANFSTAEPITLAFSRRVGQILAELPVMVSPRAEYRFYM